MNAEDYMSSAVAFIEPPDRLKCGIMNANDCIGLTPPLQRCRKEAFIEPH